MWAAMSLIFYVVLLLIADSQQWLPTRSPLIIIVRRSNEEATSTGYVKCGLPRHSFIFNGTGGNRIVGGWEAARHSIPWQVRLVMYLDDAVDGTCGGSLIRLAPGNSTRFVLTAAHCVRFRGRKEYRRPQDLEVAIGAHRFLSYEPGRVVSAVDDFTHGQYSEKSKRLDIALLHLTRTITFSDTIMPVCLPRSKEAIPTNVPCYVSGWGNTWAGGSPSSTLQVVDVKILSDDDCSIDEVTKNKSFCAGHMEGGKDACLGDSGGPLVCWVRNRFFLYGVTSYGEDCGKPGKPGVYSDVAQYIHWLRRQAPKFSTEFNPFTDSVYVIVESLSSVQYEVSSRTTY